jgi:hypothetical protein
MRDSNVGDNTVLSTGSGESRLTKDRMIELRVALRINVYANVHSIPQSSYGNKESAALLEAM